MVGSDFKMLGSGSTHDIISASALGASSWIQEPRHKLMHILLLLFLISLYFIGYEFIKMEYS